MVCGCCGRCGGAFYAHAGRRSTACAVDGAGLCSGVGVALLGKSPKSEGGALSSRAGFAGLMRKAMILIVILLAAVLDNLTGSAACTGAAAMFYIVNESLSILENAVLLGVPVPQKLTQALDVAKWTSNSEKEEPQNEKQDE